MQKNIHPDTVDVIVLCDDIRGHSGFAVNGRLVCWALSEKYNVVNAAVNGQNRTEAEIRGRTISIVPVESQYNMQMRPTELGRKGLEKLINSTDPDAVVSLLDVHMCKYIGEIQQPRRVTVQLRDEGGELNADEAAENLRSAVTNFESEANFSWVAQVPIDGHPMPAEWEGFFQECDYPIAMSDYGSEVVENQFGMEIPTIRHAVDFTEVPDIENSGFLVGCVNRNQFRKHYPRLIEAWGKFYDRVGRPDDVKFYAHCDYTDDMGWNLTRYFRRWGLEDALIPYQGKVSRRELMQLYNEMDIFTSATGGEGFGLTAIEAMSQKTPVLITDYTTSEEIVSEGDPSPRGSLIEPAVMHYEHPRFSAVPRALVDTDEFADRLVEYYENPNRVEREGANAREWVLNECGWGTVAEDWLNLFETRVLADHDQSVPA